MLTRGWWGHIPRQLRDLLRGSLARPGGVTDCLNRVHDSCGSIWKRCEWRRAFASPGWSSVIATLLALLIGVIAHLARPHAFDEPVLEGVQWAKPGMATIAWFFNDYMKYSGIPALWIMSVLWLAFGRGRPGLAMLFVLALLVFPLNDLIKETFNRPRPVGDFIIRDRPEGMSFPSAHTMTAMTFFGLWAMVAKEALPRVTHWPVRFAAAVIVALTGISRIWVAAHWPTDVVGAVLFGGAFVGLLWAARHDVDRIVDRAHEALHELDVLVLGAHGGQRFSVPDPRRHAAIEYHIQVL